MGILPTSQPTKTPVAAKRKSTQIDFGSLAPLDANAAGTKNFAGYRESASASKIKNGKKRADDAMDSDADDDEDEADKRLADEADDSKDPIKLLSAEEALQEDLLSEDVRKIKVFYLPTSVWLALKVLSSSNVSTLRNPLVCLRRKNKTAKPAPKLSLLPQLMILHNLH